MKYTWQVTMKHYQYINTTAPTTQDKMMGIVHEVTVIMKTMKLMLLYQSIQHVCVFVCAHVSDSSTWHELRHLDITNAHRHTKRHDLFFHNRWFPRRKRSVCLMCLGSDWGLHNLWIDRPVLFCDEIVSFTYYGFTLYGFTIYWFTMTGYDREGGAPPFIVR